MATLNLLTSSQGADALTDWLIFDHLADDWTTLLNRQRIRWARHPRPGALLNVKDSTAYDPRNDPSSPEYDYEVPHSNPYDDPLWLPEWGPTREGNQFSGADAVETAYRYFARQQGWVPHEPGYQALPGALLQLGGTDLATITRDQPKAVKFPALVGLRVAVETHGDLGVLPAPKPVDWKIGTLTVISSSGTEGFTTGASSPFTCDDAGLGLNAGRHTSPGDHLEHSYCLFGLASITDTDDVTNVDFSGEVTAVVNSPIVDIEPYGSDGNVDHSGDNCDTHNSTAEGGNTKDYVAGSTLFQSTGVKSGIDLGTQADADVESALSGNDFSLCMNGASGLGTFQITTTATLAHSTAAEWKLDITHAAAAGVTLPQIERHYPRGAMRGAMRGVA